MGKRFSVSKIKKHRHYTYIDAAFALGVSIQTIRSWVKKGLKVMTDTRPHLILGEDLIDFVQRHKTPRQKSAPDQFRCFKCQRLTRPLDQLVFYTPMTATGGQLEAVCEACEGPCFKWAGVKNLAVLAQILEIVTNDRRQA